MIHTLFYRSEDTSGPSQLRRFLPPANYIWGTLVKWLTKSHSHLWLQGSSETIPGRTRRCERVAKYHENLCVPAPLQNLAKRKHEATTDWKGGRDMEAAKGWFHRAFQQATRSEYKVGAWYLGDVSADHQKRYQIGLTGILTTTMLPAECGGIYCSLYFLSGTLRKFFCRHNNTVQTLVGKVGLKTTFRLSSKSIQSLAECRIG